MFKPFTVSGEKYNPMELSATDWKLEISNTGYTCQDIKISSESLGIVIFPKVRLSIFAMHHFTGDIKNRLNIDEDGNLSINNETNLSFTGNYFIPYGELLFKKEKAEQDELFFLGVSDLVEGQHYRTKKGRIFKYIGRKFNIFICILSVFIISFTNRYNFFKIMSFFINFFFIKISIKT